MLARKRIQNNIALQFFRLLAVQNYKRAGLVCPYEKSLINMAGICKGFLSRGLSGSPSEAFCLAFFLLRVEGSGRQKKAYLML